MLKQLMKAIKEYSPKNNKMSYSNDWYFIINSTASFITNLETDFIFACPAYDNNTL